MSSFKVIPTVKGNVEVKIPDYFFAFPDAKATATEEFFTKQLTRLIDEHLLLLDVHSSKQKGSASNV